MTLLLAWFVLNVSYFGARFSKPTLLRKLFSIVGALFGVLLLELMFDENAWWLMVPVFVGLILACLSEGFGNVEADHQHKIKNWLKLHLLALAIILLNLVFKQQFIQLVTFDELFLLIGLALSFCAVIICWRFVQTATPSFHPVGGKLPTVSLLIPARNEDHALEDCLQATILSDYEKLEILVLDDCSHDKTPEIIRGFAHDGVRFVEGQPVASSWLGRNWALEQLRKAANGELLLFCDVDVHIQPKTISKLVAYYLTSQSGFVSVLPYQRPSRWLEQAFAPLQSFWKVLIGSGQLPLSNAFFMVQAKKLEGLNGFGTLANDFSFEKVLAQQLGSHTTIISNEELGISSRKRVSSLLETQVRSLFPLAYLRLDAAILMVLTISIGVVRPVILGVFSGSLIAVATLLAWMCAFALLAQLEQPKGYVLPALLFPLRTVFEVGLMFISIVKYLFGKVVWKQRNICLPVLEPIASLPKII